MSINERSYLFPIAMITCGSDHPVICGRSEQFPPKTLAAHAAWVKGQKEIDVLMLMTIEPDLQRNLETHGAYNMLKELITLFSQQVEHELLQTVREFHACKQDEGRHWNRGTVSPYLADLAKNKKLPQRASTLGVNLVYLIENEDGFVNNFLMKIIHFISRNNLFYFSAIPRVGSYEIDLSNSNTNNRSMYSVRNKRAKLNLDSSLLWHCHLGHISKKRIEKSQQDGLHNSILILRL
ncbi:zinc finger, CCHC-type containing protein [Tanacetum coccineum]